MRASKQNVFIVIMVLCILVVMSLGIYNYGLSVREQLERSARDTLSEAITQQQLSFESEISTQERLLQGVARTISYIGFDSETVQGYLAVLEEHHKFVNLAATDENGYGVFSSGEMIDLTRSVLFDEAMEGKIVITDPKKSLISDEMVVTMVAPIVHNNSAVGVLMAEYPIDYLNDLINPIFSGDGYTFVVTPEGEVIACDMSEYTIANDGNLFGILDYAQFDSGESARDIAEDIVQGQAGRISYVYDGLERYAEYRLLGVNDWVLLSIVPSDVVNHDAETIIYETTGFSVVIFVGCGLLLLCIILVRNSSMKEVERAAYYDDLTGIPNMRKFKLLMTETLRKNQDIPFALVKMDVVNFKGINEMFDFEAGNRVIRAIADVKDDGASPYFINARIGVDEFLLFSTQDFFENLAESRIYFEGKFHEKVEFLAKDSVSFRYGRYYIEPGEMDANVIVDKATFAHNVAKNQKNNPICDYNASMMQKIVRNAEITSKMDAALSNREFQIYLQPKYRIKDRVVVGSEALVRWIESDGKMIFPGEFIPLFEQNGFIVELDKYMLEEVCAVLRGWMDEGIACVPISVNFSRLHLSNPMFIFELERITDRYRVPRKFIEIELTENTMLEKDGDELEEVIERLHASGFTISMDDFGSGYSSLGMLKDLDVDYIKMDRSFFVNNKYHERGQIVVESVIQMARNLKIPIVAEGVETTEQVEFLKDIGCDIAQGYFYAKPMPIGEFKKHCWGR